MRPDIEQLLKVIKPKPLNSANKRALWSRIETRLPKRSIHTTHEHYSFNQLINSMKQRMKLAVTAIVSVLVVASSGATVVLADNAKPGDFLFPVDIAAERVRLAFASDEKKDELIIRFSEERLDEAKKVLALADTVTVTTDSTSNTTATSTPADETATSTPNDIATSTPDNTATSTPNTNAETNTDKEQSPYIDTAEYALSVALEQLEKNKQKLLDDRNTLAASVVDEIIAELEGLAESHISKLQKLEIKTGNEKLKIKIKTSTQEIEAKFKINAEKSNSKKDNNRIKIEFEQKNDETEIKLKNGAVKIEYKSNEHDSDDENENVEIEDDDNNDDHKDNKKHEDDEDEDEGSDHKVIICHKPDKKGGKTAEIDRHALRKHLKHGDKLGPCDKDKEKKEDNDEEEHEDDHDEDDDDNDSSQVDTTAPTISNVNASASTTTADITWQTDEVANSAVWYGTTTPLTVSPATNKIESLILVTTHTLSLSGLADGTTYYYVVVSADADGNTATSTENSFATNAILPPDTTAPVISALTSSGITASSTTIGWTTDEDADGKVLLGATSPVNNGNALFTDSTAALTTNHSLEFTGLTASTTYYYIAISKDAPGNTATSTEQTFTTP